MLWGEEMFCKKCGAKLSDGDLFCGQCGEPVNTNAGLDNEVLDNEVLDSEVTSAPAEETVNNAVQYQAAPETATQFAQVQFSKPVKSGKKAIKIIIAAVVALAVLLTAFNVSALQGFFIKTFGSDADYFKYVEKKAFDGYTDDVSEKYGTSIENTKTQGATEAQVKLNVSEDAISLAESYLKANAGTEFELDWLNTITFNMDTVIKDNMEQVGASFKIDGQSVFDMDVILDMGENEMMVALLTLSDKYLKTSLDASSYDESSEIYSEFIRLYSNPEFRKVLPSEKELDKLLDKYIKIVIDNLDDVTKETQTLKIGDIEQKVTVLEFQLSEETAARIAQQVLETAKEDESLIEYILKISDFLEQEDLIEDADDVYDEFNTWIDDALESLEDADIGDETILTLTDYVNSKHEIIGRKIEAEDEEVLYYATLRKGKNFATEIEIPDMKIKGTGTDKNNVLNGEFTVKVDKEQLCSIIITDFDTKKAENGYLNGNIRIIPSEAMLETMGLDSTNAAVVSIADPELEFNFVSSKNMSSIDINFNNNSKLFFGFTVTSNSIDVTDIDMPSADKIVDSEDADEWADSLDVDKFISALEKTSIPEELISTIEYLLTPSYDYYDDYFNDYYDYDYDYNYDGYGYSYDYYY